MGQTTLSKLVPCVLYHTIGKVSIADLGTWRRNLCVVLVAREALCGPSNIELKLHFQSPKIRDCRTLFVTGLPSTPLHDDSPLSCNGTVAVFSNVVSPLVRLSNRLRWPCKSGPVRDQSAPLRRRPPRYIGLLFWEMTFFQNCCRRRQWHAK